MKIVVCVKQVPGGIEVKIDPETNTIIRDGRESIVNPYDSFAIEQAVRAKEQLGASTAVLSMGIPATEAILRDAMARGIDEAVLLTDRAFAGADTLATAYTLSLGVRRMGGADLIFCGKMAVDGDTAQIGPELAEFLGMPHVTDVFEVEELTEKVVTVKRKTEHGYQRLEVALPALLTLAKDINMPRMPSITGVRYGESAEVVSYGAADLEAESGRIGLGGSPTSVVRTYVPQRSAEAESVEGTAAEQAAQILSLAREVR